MKELEERIRKDGKALSGNILSVDSFLNHQLDIHLLQDIGKEFHRLFAKEGITKILTIESSGIAIACFTAEQFDVPVLFAKKAKSANISNSVYTSPVHSYTYDRDYDITVSKDYLSSEDSVLIIDDFMANGLAVQGLIDICNQAGAEVRGIGIVIEKGFQSGGKRIRKQGYHLESLAVIHEMNEKGIVFEEQ